MAATALFFSVMCVLFACLEIEIEGKYGWAERLPTWYRTRGTPARIFGLIASGKPLTGYHLFLLALLATMFHLPFFCGTEWTLGAELRQWSLLMLVLTGEDFLWFVLNPHYGITKFEKGSAWWFLKSVWVAGKFPLDYPLGLGTSILLSYLSGVVSNDAEEVARHVQMLCWMVPCFIGTILASPQYHAWYWYMRTSDDRHLAGIAHK